MQKETRQKLELIIEKANKLRDFSFENHVSTVGLGFKGTKQDDGTWLVEFGLPDTKERDAFLLTFRLFYQENEPISFPKLGVLEIDNDLSEEFKSQLKNIRALYFDYLNGTSDYSVNLFTGRPNRKLMLDVAFYGGLVHANRPDRIKQLESWCKDDVPESVFWQDCTWFLTQILGLIYSVADLCQIELSKQIASI